MSYKTKFTGHKTSISRQSAGAMGPAYDSSLCLQLALPWAHWLLLHLVNYYHTRTGHWTMIGMTAETNRKIIKHKMDIRWSVWMIKVFVVEILFNSLIWPSGQCQCACVYFST